MCKNKIIDRLWDSWCILSVVGIWPRFIEPSLLSVTKIELPTSQMCEKSGKIKILQLSDLHWSGNFSRSFQCKITQKINQLQPDIIVFTGDFLIQSRLESQDALLQFLNSLEAPFGCFAILGNHDYATYVTVNAKGDYDVEKDRSENLIFKGFKRLFNRVRLTSKVSEEARETVAHSELLQLITRSSFQLLHNKSQLLTINGCKLNVCGLGEYTLGCSQPKQAFENYDSNYPGIVLTHNPDSVPMLLNYPGDLILCGHTHGGQLNLPFIWKKFTRLENSQFKRGLKKIRKKHIYINRGVGSGIRFRWFSRPELTLFTLVAK